MRVLKSLVLGGMVLASGLVFGQNPPMTGPVIWGDGVVFLFPSFDEDGIHGQLRIESQNGKVERSIALPKGTVCTDVSEEKVYAMVPVPLEQGAQGDYRWTNRIYAREVSGGAWREVAHAKNRSREWSRFARLENGNFLAVSIRPVFIGDGGYSPFGILQPREDGELRQKAAPLCGFERPVWQEKLGPRGAGILNYKHLWMLAPTILRTPTHIVVGLEDLGWFFIFRAKDGGFERRVGLFDFIDEKALSGDQFHYPYVGLGAQVRSDGRILIASRSMDAVQNAHLVFSSKFPAEIAKDPGRALDWYRKTEPIREQNLKQFPQIAWWTLDPVTGRIEKETPPARFPDRVSSISEMRNWNWRFKADGNLLNYPTPGATEGSKQTVTDKILKVIGVR